MLARPRPAALAALLVALLAPAGRADTAAGLAAIREESVRASVEHLASDALEGRGSGARGGHAAGEWLAGQLAALGLAPAGDDGYFQPFEAQGQRMRNVLAHLPGREPGEAVVIGAHYDHLGLGHQQGSLEFLRGRGRVHNGADDNASGTAAVLEVARAFVASGLQPRRRVVFAFFDGEERGLLGSTHYVEQATGERVALMINLDMVGRLRRAVTVYGANTGDRLAGWLEEANRPLGLELDLRRSMTPNSDHWPFYQRRVPVLMPFTGLHTDYHRPSDVVARLNVEGIARIARLCFGVAALAADAEDAAVFAEAPDGTGEAVLEQLQAMLGVERFGERLRELRERLGVGEGEGLERVGERLRDLLGGRGRGERGPAARPRLGVTLEGGGPGARVQAVTPGSLAERAGVRPGDRIVRFGGAEVRDPDGLRALVAGARGPVEVEVERRGGRAVVVARFPGEAPAPVPDADGRRWF
ncbi:MAG: M20/M25/M40 family metallo-hydrolase [Planctomycetes bacterium]|nr:M20/M25/M40 family metallo-hydrolase [Planctomycetota bacterium]